MAKKPKHKCDHCKALRAKMWVCEQGTNVCPACARTFGWAKRYWPKRRRTK